MKRKSILALALGVILAIGSGFTAKHLDKVYYKVGEDYFEVPGGPGGQGTQWHCDLPRETDCVYDENFEVIELGIYNEP